MNDCTWSVCDGSVVEEASRADVFIVIPVCKLEARASKFSSTVRCCGADASSLRALDLS